MSFLSTGSQGWCWSVLRENRLGQMVYAIVIEEYIYLVPFVESEEEVILKTIILSRKATRRYWGSSNG